MGFRGCRQTKLNRQYETVMRLWEDGFNDCEIARLIGCSSAAVFSFRKRNGMGRNCDTGNHHPIEK